jgi:RHS repeat-associated protein
LKFFNHPEGYVDASGSGYVYQYKDHLGNVRLSYKNTGSTSTPTLEIQEESNFYPFGLKHRGYNTNVNSTNLAQNWKFQGQEETNDPFGFNMVEFKWRMHDPAIGRFMQIDPLAEDYAYNGTYNFAENRVMDGIELEGLEHLSHTVYSVHKDSDGNYNATYDRSASQRNVGDWSGTKHQNTYNVFNSDGIVTAIYSGDTSLSDMKKEGISLASVKTREVTASDIIDWAANNPEFQRAGKTLQNGLAVAGLVVAAPAVLAGEASVLTYLGVAGDLDTILGGENGAVSDNIENKHMQNFISAYNMLTATVGKNMSIDDIIQNGGSAENIVELTKSINDMIDSMKSLKDNNTEKED